MGSLAAEKPEHNKPLSGILIKRGFNYHLIAPEDLQSKSVNSLDDRISKSVEINFLFTQCRAIVADNWRGFH